MTRARSIATLLACLVVPITVGVGSSLVTVASVNGWYLGIEKPSWNPPDAVFGPVWTLLYLMMGLALWRVLRITDRPSYYLAPFALQLVLNGLWTLIFFGLHRPGWAAIEIVVLWISIVLTICRFSSCDRWAGRLLWPYLGWVSFAAVLNITIWWMNS